MDSDFNMLVSSKEIYATGGYTVSEFLALPDDTFLLIATNSTNHGQEYLILDDTLEIVSGPTAAFTGLTSDNSALNKGAAV